MSVYSDYKTGAMSDAEFANHCAEINRKARLEEEEWHTERMSEEEMCWEEGTGEGDCAECDHRWECSGSPYCEEDEEE